MHLCRWALLCLLLTLPAPGASGEEPAFLITGIEVTGTRWVSRELVISESRLEASRSYTESELAQALGRIRRLPFVRDAEFSLRRGQAYGTYTLVVQVTESRPWVVNYVRTQVQGQRERQVGGGDPTTPAPGSSDRTTTGQDLAVGGRAFFSAYGFGYVIAKRGDPDQVNSPDAVKTVDAGLSYYNLFDRGIFVNIDCRFRGGDTIREYDEVTGFSSTVERRHGVSPSLTVSVPLKRSHWLSFDLSYGRETQRYDSFGRGEVLQDRVSDQRLQMGASWLYDTTDDPSLPVTGSRAEGGLSFIQQRSRFDLSRDPTGPGSTSQELLESTDSTARATQLYLTAIRYWALNERFTVFAGAQGSARVLESGGLIADPGYDRFAVDAGTSCDLWGRRLTEKFGDLRFEAGARVLRESHEYLRATRWHLDAGLVYRSDWALVRMTFRFLRESSTVRERPVSTSK